MKWGTANVVHRDAMSTPPTSFRHSVRAGEQKKGDLSLIRVYKFKMLNQPTLLGYSYEDGSIILELLALGSH